VDASSPGADAEPEPLHFELGDEAAGRRLDSVLAELAEVSRSQARRWIEAGRVEVDGRSARPSQRLSAGALLDARPPAPERLDVEPENIALDVLYEDDDLIVLDKPAGMVVHPGPGHPSGTLVNALLHHCTHLAGVGGVLRPGIVHRLDRGTSGVMVAAKSDAAHQGLSSQFQDHSIERAYHAFIRSVPRADEGRIERPIGRHPQDRKRMSVRTRSGREAVTCWRVLERFPRCASAYLEIEPETGRTHQIRVHLASAGMPIAGDPVYGRLRGSRMRRGLPRLERPALHARVLGFQHPTRDERLHFEAPLPADLEAWLAAARAGEEGVP
jgi:23S rRNA pseudouridine1911/1915/1917 synthase